MSLPRVITLGPDNRLLMRPADELETLRYNASPARNVAIRGGQAAVEFDAVEENVLELQVELRSGGAKEMGVKVCCSPDGRDETLIGYDFELGTLRIDTTRTGPNQRKRTVEAAPMKLARNETLTLRVLVDRSVVEVFANDGRLALCRSIYPSPGSGGIRLYTRGGTAKASVRLWDIMPTNPY